VSNATRQIWRSFQHTLDSTLIVTFFLGLSIGVFGALVDHSNKSLWDIIFTPLSLALIAMACGTLIALPCVFVGTLINYFIIEKFSNKPIFWQKWGLPIIGAVTGTSYGMLALSSQAPIAAACGFIIGVLVSNKNLHASPTANTSSPPLNSLRAQYLRAVIATISASPFGGLVGGAIYILARQATLPDNDPWHHDFLLWVIVGPLAGLFYTFPLSFFAAISLTYLVNKGWWNPLSVILCVLLCSSFWTIFTPISSHVIFPGTFAAGCIIYILGEYVRYGRAKNA